MSAVKTDRVGSVGEYQTRPVIKSGKLNTWTLSLGVLAVATLVVATISTLGIFGIGVAYVVKTQFLTKVIVAASNTIVMLVALTALCVKSKSKQIANQKEFDPSPEDLINSEESGSEREVLTESQEFHFKTLLACFEEDFVAEQPSSQPQEDQQLSSQPTAIIYPIWIGAHQKVMQEVYATSFQEAQKQLQEKNKTLPNDIGNQFDINSDFAFQVTLCATCEIQARKLHKTSNGNLSDEYRRLKERAFDYYKNITQTLMSQATKPT